MDVCGCLVVSDELRRPWAQPRGGEAQGDLQRQDAQVCALDAYGFLGRSDPWPFFPLAAWLTLLVRAMARRGSPWPVEIPYAESIRTIGASSREYQKLPCLALL